MATDQISLDRQKNNATVLANAGELVAGVIREIAGNDISNSLNGSKVTSDVIQGIAYQRMLRNLDQQAKAV